MTIADTARVPRISLDAILPNGPVPSLAERVIALLHVDEEDLVVDLDCSDLEPFQAIAKSARAGARMITRSPFSERLAFLLITSGIRMARMGTRTFGRFPMQYKQVVLRDGFSQLEGSLRRMLAAVLGQLDPAGRVLIVDSAPSPDSPLFARGLRRWKRQHRPPGLIAELMREVGFSARVETVECSRRVPAAKCYTWVESRDWSILESFRELELQRGLSELRARYGSQHFVEFTSRFDLVLGTKSRSRGSQVGASTSLVDA